MKRHLFLVLNHGDWIEPLPNVKYDRENYLRFFSSPEGGYWGKDEISVYDNNFNFLAFKDNIRFQQLIKEPYDFIVFVFCGHGGVDNNGRKVIQPQPNGAVVSLNEIKQACQGIRTLFISDSCLVLPENSINESTRLFSSDLLEREDTYAQRCKQLYNHYVMETSSNAFTAGFGVSVGESADDDENGGYYSQTLLEVARDIIPRLKKDPLLKEMDCLSFPAAHNLAAKHVERITNGKQHPSIEMSRDKAQLPFIVVPKNLI